VYYVAQEDEKFSAAAALNNSTARRTVCELQRMFLVSEAARQGHREKVDRSLHGKGGAFRYEKMYLESLQT